ncbi:hypothetical protein PHACT_04310 [Pseudohongiella acticola]|uniref:ABC transporter domain-containing protein n=2 Tax=Pseudohongiella acticola TaxID=1524254 RepID=A0A1E8CJ67_9GAMM|nr:hypothetical protein PHACT_04310 [Pseudohongiella acticola]
MVPVLEVAGLNKTYSSKGETVKAVNNISFSVNPGEIVGVLGPNGSGKTTTLKSICGLNAMDTGLIRVNGEDIEHQQWAAMLSTGAVLEGARNVYWRLTPQENIVYFAGLKGVPRNEACLRAQELIDRLSLNKYCDQQVRMLSKGNQQKVAIACALVHRPSLILLDEPTLGLDVDMVRDMKDWLRQLVDTRLSAMLVTSHDMDFIEAICDRVIILYQGEVISQNSVEELRRQFSPQKTFDLQVQGHPSGSVKADLETSQWSIEENATSSRLTLRTGDLDTLSLALASLEQSGHRLIDINVTSDALEDIFIHTIKRTSSPAAESISQASAGGEQ